MKRTWNKLPPNAMVKIEEDNESFDRLYSDLEIAVWREAGNLVVGLTIKEGGLYWQDKYDVKELFNAMLTAIEQYKAEGAPFDLGSVVTNYENYHMLQWCLRIPTKTSGKNILAVARCAFNLVWERAVAITGGPNRVLLIGEKCGKNANQRRQISKSIRAQGHNSYQIVNGLPQRLGGLALGVPQYALFSRFVIIANTKPKERQWNDEYEYDGFHDMDPLSWHVSFPEVKDSTWLPVCILQEAGYEAIHPFSTKWFKDNPNFRLFIYDQAEVAVTVIEAAKWAEDKRAEIMSQMRQTVLEHSQIAVRRN